MNNNPFDAEIFRSTGHQLIDLLAQTLSENYDGKNHVLNWKSPTEADLLWQKPLPLNATLTHEELIIQLRDCILPSGLAIHHPRNLGHQVATPLPIAALCDLVASLTNQAMAVYETGPMATLLERQVLRWLNLLVGWNHAGGVLTSGGAQANLTALLVARQKTADGNVWKNGVKDNARLKIIASEHAHYSISRAAGIMGLGTDAVIKIASNHEGRMSITSMEEQYQHAISNQDCIISVVANAGCTATGSIDPLDEIGKFCERENLWFHVDGAHGASALLSKKHSHALHGIERANSIVWDGHKLMYMPATVSAVLFRKPQDGFSAFSQQASYLFQDDSGGEAEFNISLRTLECTKRMMALKLWAAFSLYGVSGMGQLVEQVFSMARLLADKLSACNDFVLLMPPQTNIVCFRHKGSDQSAIRRAIIESGAFHLTQVTQNNAVWLRTTLMNPLTTEQDLDALIQTIRQFATKT